MKKTKGKILLPSIFFVVYIILDYINFPSKLGIAVTKLNSDILGIMINSTIVVTLFIVSYYYVDNKQNKKDAESKYTAIVLLRDSYFKCSEMLRILEDNECIRKYIIPKIEFNNVISENITIQNFLNDPFRTKNEIMTLACNGHVEKVALNEYLNIQKIYNKIVVMKLVFYDLPNQSTGEQITAYKDIQEKENELKNLLKNQIELCNNKLDIKDFTYDQL